MTLIKTFEEGSDAIDECLAVAEELFKEAGLALANYIGKIRRAEITSDREAKLVASELSAATLMFLKEKNRVAEERKRSAGIVGSYAVDLGAARAEIGRRLARLRDTGDG